jgi:hypothetical protein
VGQRDFAGHQRVIVSNVGPFINGAMLQFNTKAGAELFKIDPIPHDTQLLADCACLIQGKNCFLAHSIKLILDQAQRL